MTTPLIRRLQKLFPELPFVQVEHDPLNWTFTESIKKLGPEFYRKIIPLHLVLNLEYSLLGQQLRTKFLTQQVINSNALIKELITALMMAELLEHIYQYYLIVPREVIRLRQQQELYRQLLAEVIMIAPTKEITQVNVGLAFSQQVRTATVNANLYRLLLIRSKRALDLIMILDTGSEKYRYFVQTLDKYTDPVLAHLSWIFFLPRLSVNLFLLLKHTIPGDWMEEKENSLGWSVRFNAQIQRRWFELGNDINWFTAGFINCFWLTGVLAPIGMYLSLTCFALDVVLSATRVYIELKRLHDLHKQYTHMLCQPSTVEEKNEIKEHLKTIENQILFEQLRFGSHLLTTIGIFLSMACAIPLFPVNPVIPVVGAICLVLICFINFALVHVINEHRPQDTIEFSSGVTRLGFFSKKEQEKVEVAEVVPENQLCCT